MQILSRILVASIGALLTGSLHAQTFTSATSGEWTSGSTWVGGSAPDTDADGVDIVIVHDVNVANDDIKLIGDATLTVSNVRFSMANGNFTVEEGSASFSGCQVVIADGHSLQITKDTAALSMIGCEVAIGQNFQNSEGTRYLENICLVVNENFQNAKGTDTLINVCALIGAESSGNFQNDSDSSMTIMGSEFHLPNGDFQNQSSASLSGDITALWLENGNFQNSGTWSASVANFCVSGSVSVPSGFLPGSQDCGGAPAFFDPCDCSGDDVTPYCRADQGDCPCLNEDPSGGCSNSSGSGARLSVLGTTSVFADDLRIVATRLPTDAPTLFLMANAPRRASFLDGLLCVGGPTSKIYRLPPVINSGPSGTAIFGPGLVQLSKTPLVPVPSGIQAGETWYLQAFFRDGNGCGAGANTSDALAVTFVP